MPRNISGGSGHKAQSNSEGSKARNNRVLVDELLDDLRNGENVDGVYVGRVLRRMGSGRMEVIYFKPRKADEDEGAGVEMLQQIMPMRGGLRGKGKSSVWVDLDAVVMIAETGLSGTTHEIVAVFSPDHIKRYRKLVPTADERLFMKQGQEDEDSGGGVIFEAEEQEEVNIDDI
jgi:hypothetical protein